MTITPGQPVLSPESGRIVFVGTVVDRRVVTIDHGGGLLSSFEPASAVLAVGDTVSAGQTIATVSAGGHCRTGCLHWGVRLDGEYVNPLNFVTDRRPSVLLPLTD